MLARTRRTLFLAVAASAPWSGCSCDEGLGALQGSVEVVPEVLDFGRVPKGSSKQAPLVLKNRGTFRLNLEGFVSDAPFVAPSETASIAAGGELEILVGFRPDALGAVNGTLHIQTDDMDGPTVEVPLVGEGIEAAVEIDPLSIDFGEVLWSNESDPEIQTVTITNPGSDTLEVETISFAEDGGGVFSLDAILGLGSYAPGESRSFDVSYFPSGLGPQTGRIRVETTAPSAPELFVTLEGTGVGPVLDLCSAVEGGPELCTQAQEVPRLDFGYVARDGMADGYVRVINSGDRDLTFSPRLSGVLGDFVITPAFDSIATSVLSPGQDQRFDVRYAPQDYAGDTVVLLFVSNAYDTTQSIRAEARVRQATIRVQPGGVGITIGGNVTHGEATVDVYNCGKEILQFSSDVVINQLSGPAQGVFSLIGAPTTASTIAPDTCEDGPPGLSFTVAFDTQTAGSYTAEIPVASNDPTTPVFVVDVQAGKN